MFDFRYGFWSPVLLPGLRDRSNHRALSEQMRRTAAGLIGTMLLASLCLFGATAAAFAESRENGERRMAVHFADLDLSHEAGRRTLHNRLLTAARSVCSEASTHHSAKAAQSRCIRQAMQDAMAPTFETAG